MTYEGYPICLNEYTTWIATEEHTHVIHIDDSFTLKEEEHRFFEEAINPDIPLEEDQDDVLDYQVSFLDIQGTR